MEWDDEQIYRRLYYLFDLLGEVQGINTRRQDTLVDAVWLKKKLNHQLLFPIIRLSSVNLDSFESSNERGTNSHHRRVYLRQAGQMTEDRKGFTEASRNTLPTFISGSRWGLDVGLGFYSFINRPETYYIDNRGEVKSQKLPGGANTLLSAHLYCERTEHDRFFLSVPVVAVAGNRESRIGLISSRPTLGIGYARMFSGMGAYFSLLSAPFKQYDADLLNELLFEDRRLEMADLSEYPSITKYHLIASFGLNIPIY